MKIKSNKKGFTLIELVIVVVLIGVLSAMAAPLFTSGYNSKMRLKEAGRNVVSTLRVARSMAVTQKSYFGIKFDSVSKTYLLFKDKVNIGNAVYETGDSLISTSNLFGSLSIYGCTFANTTVVFKPDGSATGTGTLVLAGSGAPYNLTVDVLASTGRVKIFES
jgi:prepilin-type N-terminal cleavage/methylation domain-containing protein